MEQTGNRIPTVIQGESKDIVPTPTKYKLLRVEEDVIYVSPLNPTDSYKGNQSK